ncbi:terC [Symbiodinium pilosum]|uniref:TerC protein n=1 Tax=Symbiodinium pilosum TaxID=2952 RepID=A0A812RYM1_SYMPI|nr:terC [Symbiodinium pilosum]
MATSGKMQRLDLRLEPVTPSRPVPLRVDQAQENEPLKFEHCALQPVVGVEPQDTDWPEELGGAESLHEIESMAASIGEVGAAKADHGGTTKDQQLSTEMEATHVPGTKRLGACGPEELHNFENESSGVTGVNAEEGEALQLTAFG